MILDGRIPKGSVRPPLVPKLIIVDEAVGRIEVGIIPALGVVQDIPITVLVLLFLLVLAVLVFPPRRPERVVRNPLPPPVARGPAQLRLAAKAAGTDQNEEYHGERQRDADAPPGQGRVAFGHVQAGIGIHPAHAMTVQTTVADVGR